MIDFENRHGGSPLIRIYLPYIYELASHLDPLSKIKSGPLEHHWLEIKFAQSALVALLNNSVFSYNIRISRQLGAELLEVLTKVDEKDITEELTLAEEFQITSSFSQFRTAFIAEMGVQPSYFVTPKQGYDTIVLLDAGCDLYPADVKAKLPDAVFDLNEAAKALAFELGTACAFHVFRAVEVAVRRYYQEVTNNEPAPKVRNLGVYIRKLRKLGLGDEKIISALEHIKDLHRNPIAHPEAAINIDGAITIMGLARSIIQLISEKLPVPNPTTMTEA